jgi:hypothetical protein
MAAIGSQSAAVELPPIHPTVRERAETMLAEGQPRRTVARLLAEEGLPVTRYQIDRLSQWLDAQRASA